MPAKRKRGDLVDWEAAQRLLDTVWTDVRAKAERSPEHEHVGDTNLRRAIAASINHPQVSYRFCLPVQLLGKMVNPDLDALALQKGGDATGARGWDARSLASKVVAPFNLAQEGVLGTANDPYVGNAMRIPRMLRTDTSKRDRAGWSALIDVLEQVEAKNDLLFTTAVFSQVLLEFHRRQTQFRFKYAVPPRVSLDGALGIARQFLLEKSGGDRALALAGALFDVIAQRFHLFKRVNRARINASDAASGQAADLECVDSDGRVVLAVEVKDRALTLADVEGTITKTRHRAIAEVLFAVTTASDAEERLIEGRVAGAFATGQNLYRTDLLELAKAVLTLAGETGRVLFLSRVGEHLNEWNTQPRHRQAWKVLLESL